MCGLKLEGHLNITQSLYEYDVKIAQSLYEYDVKIENSDLAKMVEIKTLA